MPREGGLGKGLSSLIPQKRTSNNPIKTDSKNSKKDFVFRDLDSEIVTKDLDRKIRSKNIFSENSILNVDINEIKTNPFQPRQYFDETKLEELALSIRKHGVIQPLVVTEHPEGGFELVAGERRFKASKKNGLTTVPVIVKKICDKEKLEWALIENIQRHDLNAIEEAEAYQGLIDKFGYLQEEIAKQVSKSRSAISNTLRLLDLSDNIKKRVKTGKISEGHARALLSLNNENKREIMVEEIIKKELSVRETERKIKAINNSNSDIKNFVDNDPEISEFENKISQALGTKVNIKRKRSGGSFILNYYSEEEFNNLFNKLIS